MRCNNDKFCLGENFVVAGLPFFLLVPVQYCSVNCYCTPWPCYHRSIGDSESETRSTALRRQRPPRPLTLTTQEMSGIHDMAEPTAQDGGHRQTSGTLVTKGTANFEL